MLVFSGGAGGGFEPADDLGHELAGMDDFGINRSEPCLGDMKGWWSSRIAGAHRIVYRVNGNGAAEASEIASCRYHRRWSPGAHAMPWWSNEAYRPVT